MLNLIYFSLFLLCVLCELCVKFSFSLSCVKTIPCQMFFKCLSSTPRLQGSNAVITTVIGVLLITCQHRCDGRCYAWFPCAPRRTLIEGIAARPSRSYGYPFWSYVGRVSPRCDARFAHGRAADRCVASRSQTFLKCLSSARMLPTESRSVNFPSSFVCER